MHDSSRQYYANLKRLKLIHDVGLSNYWLLAKNATIERQIREQNKFMPMKLVNCTLYQQILNVLENCPKNHHHYYWSVISIHYWLHVIYKVESTIHNMAIICDAWKQVSLTLKQPPHKLSPEKQMQNENKPTIIMRQRWERVKQIVCLCEVGLVWGRCMNLLNR